MNDQKLARICWNTNNWMAPSGATGKSGDKNSYESQYGFGHEEWLLDRSRMYKDGYHYAFLQPFNTAKSAHAGKTYDVHLFTVSPDKEKIYIGCIKNVTGISQEERDRILSFYNHKGWLTEMKNEASNAGANVSDFWKDVSFNVKFRFEDVDINPKIKRIIKNIPGLRYNLMNLEKPLVFEMDENEDDKILDTSTEHHVIKGGIIEVNPWHKKIQNSLKSILSKEYKNIKLEQETEFGQRIDIQGVEKSTGELHFFEIKTDSARRSIREALGQILEYCHYPSERKADKLFIIGCDKPNADDRAYLRLLRETYGLPLFYRYYSFENNSLGMEA